MSALSEFFFATHPAVIQLQMLEITHPNFTAPLRFVRNAVNGARVFHEGEVVSVFYTYMPMQIKTLGANSSLDQSIEVTFGDVGLVLPAQLEILSTANGFQTKPVMKYREYRSDNYSMTTFLGNPTPIYIEPMFGPFTLEINGIAFNKSGASFTGKPKAFNRSRTGEIYDPGRFPMLRGFL